LLLAGAAAAQTPIVLIPLEGEKRDLKGIEKRLLKALDAAGRPATPSTRTMAQLQEAAGCTEDSPPCLVQVGREARANEFIYGSVFRDGRKLQMTLRRFSVDTGREEGRAQTDMRRASTRAISQVVDELLRAPDAPAATSAPAAYVGTLEVTCAIEGVLIRVNGQPRGTAPLRLEEIGVASYDLEAEKAGYRTWRGQANVEAGKVATVQVILEALPEALRAAAAAEPSSIRTRTWVTGGAATVLLATAAVFAVVTASAQNDFDEDVKQLEPGPGASQEASDLEGRADSGENKALIANILFGVGGAAAIVTGVFVYLDLSSPAPAKSISLQPTGLTIRF